MNMTPLDGKPVFVIIHATMFMKYTTHNFITLADTLMELFYTGRPYKVLLDTSFEKSMALNGGLFKVNTNKFQIICISCTTTVWDGWKLDLGNLVFQGGTPTHQIATYVPL